MTVQRINRRHLLLGAAGFGLGVPLLRSLLPRTLGAQELAPERRFVAYGTDHGGIFETEMFPDENLLNEETELYPGHSIRRGDLVRTEADDRASLSTVLSGPAARLTDSIVERMNVLRGLDIPFYIAHHTGGHLGNFARNDGNGEDAKALQAFPMPTIDQLLAWSPSFYENLSGITERSLVLTGGGRMSWNWSSPSNQTGEIQEIAGEKNPKEMFNRVFIPGEPAPEGPEPRAPIVDRVLQSYQSLRQSDRRLSLDDRQRLDDHMERLYELERRLNVEVAPRASCAEAKEPGTSSFEDPAKYYEAVNDVIAAAFLCGTSRIAVVRIAEDQLVESSGEWHADVAHQWSSPEPQALLQLANQRAFEHGALDLAHKLNVEESPGQNLLDNTLIQWTQESGETTHESRSAPVVTIGRAGGSIQTGNYCDYRNLSPEAMVGELGPSGLLYSQWLATVLQIMGMPRSEFQDIEHNGETGYCHPHIGSTYESVHVQGVSENASELLPLVT